MTDMSSGNPELAGVADGLAAVVEQASRHVVSVVGRNWSASGICWRPGIIVTAEHAVERDDNIALSSREGRQMPARLVGRDPTTDVAVLTCESDGAAVAEIGDAARLRAGQLVVALGRDPDHGTIASLGIVSVAGAAWRSMRGGLIDRMIRLDLNLPRPSEGGPLVDVAGRTVGMSVPGPRRRVLTIPASTIDRVVDHVLAKGRVARGFLGLAMQPVELPERVVKALGLAAGAGVIVLRVETDGPGDRAGVLVGDVIVAVDGEAVSDTRSVLSHLGPDSVGRQIGLRLVRGGTLADASVTIGERTS